MIVKYVQKNDGRVEKFRIDKLEKSVLFAMDHIGKRNVEFAKELVHEIINALDDRKKEVVSSDQIRETVLHVIGHDRRDLVEAYEMSSLHIPKITLKKVEKLAGDKEEFHAHKIFKSVRKACTDCGIVGAKLAEEVTKQVVKKLEKEYKGKSVPVLKIKNEVAKALEEKGFDAVARMYYGHKFL